MLGGDLHGHRDAHLPGHRRGDLGGDLPPGRRGELAEAQQHRPDHAVLLVGDRRDVEALDVALPVPRHPEGDGRRGPPAGPLAQHERAGDEVAEALVAAAGDDRDHRRDAEERRRSRPGRASPGWRRDGTARARPPRVTTRRPMAALPSVRPFQNVSITVG